MDGGGGTGNVTHCRYADMTISKCIKGAACIYQYGMEYGVRANSTETNRSSELGGMGGGPCSGRRTAMEEWTTEWTRAWDWTGTASAFRILSSLLSPLSSPLLSSPLVGAVNGAETLGDGRAGQRRAHCEKTKHRKSTEHFWSTICSDIPYSGVYGSSVPVFCGIFYRVLRTPQRIRTTDRHSVLTLSVLHFLCVFCTKALCESKCVTFIH